MYFSTGPRSRAMFSSPASASRARQGAPVRRTEQSRRTALRPRGIYMGARDFRCAFQGDKSIVREAAGGKLRSGRVEDV
ncbi:hypothetical protein BM221_006018 [Beauveria bassiana]|uniref:Uncharacterized protein n=1 Tax=Beauveria bassiana TaxID=176275 RepID=A0A2N6NKR0_BEABA|nr:hypothetical protein BM221_006018 [Beauveria bassiana]